MTGRGIAIGAVLSVLMLASAADLAKLHRDTLDRMVDFSAFYCAGERVVERRDPYAAAPLGACERRLNSGQRSGYAIPAPLPPYALVPFALLARTQYGFAKAVMRVAIVAAGLATAFALAAIGIPFFAALAALALSTVFVGLLLGQIYPFTVALIALCAAALSRERFAAAGIAGALTMIQPQIGIPIVLSLLFWAARARISLIITIAVLAMTGVAAAGPSTLLEWATRVVPDQARFEAGFYGQYSFTSILTQVGLRPNPALLLGTLSYVVMLCVSLWLAKRVASERNRLAYLATLPPALCLLGGTYVHLPAMAAAVPLALLLAHGAGRSALPYAVVPLLLLSIPWPLAQAMKALFFPSLLVVIAQLTWLRVPLRPSVLAASATAALLYAIALKTPPPLPVWSPYPPGPDLLRELSKVPTWLGLFGLLALSANAAIRQRRTVA